MHPGFYGWWRARGRGCHGEAHAHGGHWHAGAGGHGHGHVFGEREGVFAGHGFDFEGGHAFGVRRPLRFLAHKLELSEPQVEQLAAILDELKIERAQAAVDQRRRISSLAEALEASVFDEDKVRAAGDEQLRSGERVRQAVERALRKIHAMLDTDQRTRLAYLLRTGVLSL